MSHHLVTSWGLFLSLSAATVLGHVVHPLFAQLYCNLRGFILHNIFLFFLIGICQSQWWFGCYWYSVGCGLATQCGICVPSLTQHRQRLILVDLSGFGPPYFSSVSSPWTAGQASLHALRCLPKWSLSKAVILRLQLPICSGASSLSRICLCSTVGVCLSGFYPGLILNKGDPWEPGHRPFTLCGRAKTCVSVLAWCIR